MAPEWYVESQLHAEESYDPSQNNGIRWDELSTEDQEKRILEAYDNLYLGAV